VPELPELEVVRERLGPLIEGHVVGEVKVSPRFGFLLRTPVEQLSGRLAGRTVARLWRRGKFLSLDLGDAQLVINPMLGGRFRVSAPAEKATDSTLVRVVLDGGEEFRLTDSARMARIYLVEDAAFDAVPGWARMGPEATEVPLEEWTRRIRRHPGELKNLLRNQEFVAGVGNAYSDEILHDARLLPLRRRSTLKPDDVTRLWESTGSVLRWAIDQIRGQPEYTSEKQDRSFMRVHMRGGKDCPRCGHRISELTARGEVTNFCRGCQF